MAPVLVAGGGIGGLTLAIALAQRGIASRVFEARAEPPREGAGIQLGPNATRILQTLGLAEALEPHTVSPECIVVNDGVTGRELVRLPLGDWIAGRHGAPYWVVHRATLHELLWSAAQSSQLIAIEMGHVVERINRSAGPDGVSISLSSGEQANGRLLAGADGLWSRVRDHIDPGFSLHYSGLAAARAVASRTKLPKRFDEMSTGVWLAPNAHIVHYPIDGGDQVALVAIGKCSAPTDGWSHSVSQDVVASRFAQLPSAVCELLGEADNWRQWPLFTTTGGTSWSKGHCVLIGDAAHPILPFLAQGGAMAIEDGFELAGAIADAPDDPDAAIATFVGNRQLRTVKIQSASEANGRTYHLNGFAALARNTALKVSPGSLLMRRYDWIYGWRPAASAAPKLRAQQNQNRE